MIEFNITNEEINALKDYKEKNYEAINQMLVSNAETDLALLSSEVEKKSVSISYDRESVVEYLRNIKLIYRLILKQFYSKKYKIKKNLYRGTNISEIENIKNELYIDRFLTATEHEEEAINNYAANWNRPACINLILDQNIPFIFVKDVLKEKKYKNEILISPFTRIKHITEENEKRLEKNSKEIKIFNIELEKQSLDALTERERKGLYNYILENAYSIRRKIVESIDLEKENTTNFENIRKLEQLLSKYENEIEEKETSSEYSDIDREEDLDDIERITKELDELKKVSTSLFEVRKENINFINMWKRNIAVYMIAECREIEKEFDQQEDEETECNSINKNDNVDENEQLSQEEVIVDNICNLDEEDNKENLSEESEEDVKTIEQDIVKEDEIENVEQEVVDAIVESSIEKEQNKEDNQETKIVNVIEEKKEDSFTKEIKEEAHNNIVAAEKLLLDINDLISKQQNHAKIAGNMEASYSALNNAFEMRKKAETLLEQLKNINLKVNAISESDEDDKQEKLLRISKKNIEISTLINYLNNPKIVAANTNATRFDEMIIIEENELKRGIAERIREIRGEAELKKLKDDLEIIEDKGSFSRFLGIFTGQNKLDEFMIDQIEIRQIAIRRTLSNKLSLAYNYSIHEMMAEIEMFIDENYDDELVEKDVRLLEKIENELRRHFVIVDSKVEEIINQKEGKYLPTDKRKMTKRDLIETETYRFLNKYGYDINKKYSEEPKYQDTMANEISRIVEYINSANIL